MQPIYPAYLQHPFPFLEIDLVVKLPTNEKMEYQEQLKTYRDLKNVIDTAFQDGEVKGEIKGIVKSRLEGRLEGRIEGRLEGIKEGELATKTKSVIKALKQGVLPIEGIAEILDVTIEFVLQIKKENNL